MRIGRLYLFILICLSASAAPFYSTSVGLEGRSNVDSCLCACTGESVLGQYASASLTTTGAGGVGTYTGNVWASTDFGTMRIDGSFSVSGFPAGSNVALKYDNGATIRDVWNANPVGGLDMLRDVIQLVGPIPTAPGVRATSSCSISPPSPREHT